MAELSTLQILSVNYQNKKETFLLTTVYISVSSPHEHWNQEK